MTQTLENAVCGTLEIGNTRGPLASQQVDEIGVAVNAGLLQRSAAQIIPGRHLAAAADERDRHLRMPLHRCQHQRSASVVVSSVRSEALLQHLRAPKQAIHRLRLCSLRKMRNLDVILFQRCNLCQALQHSLCRTSQWAASSMQKNDFNMSTSQIV